MSQQVTHVTPDWSLTQSIRTETSNVTSSQSSQTHSVHTPIVSSTHAGSVNRGHAQTFNTTAQPQVAHVCDSSKDYKSYAHQTVKDSAALYAEIVELETIAGFMNSEIVTQQALAQQRLGTIRDQAIIISSHEHQIELLKEQLASSVNQKEAFRIQYEWELSKTMKLEESVKGLGNTIDALSNQNKTLRCENEVTREVFQLVAQITGAKCLDEIVPSIIKYHDKAHKDVVKEMEHYLMVKQAKIGSLMLHMRGLQSEKDQLDEAHSSLLIKHESLTLAHDELKGAHQYLLKAGSAVKVKCERLMKDIRELKESKMATESELADEKLNSESLRSILDERERKTEELTDRIKTLERENEQLNAKLNGRIIFNGFIDPEDDGLGPRLFDDNTTLNRTDGCFLEGHQGAAFQDGWGWTRTDSGANDYFQQTDTSMEEIIGGSAFYFMDNKSYTDHYRCTDYANSAYYCKA